VDNIRDHARSLTDHLQEELPRRGYPSITPRGNDSPIVTFEVKDPASTASRLRDAGVHVAMRYGNKMRLSPSVYNSPEDVDRLLEALP
jgi:selenocysteine lyase/cysteine desulfurase